MSLPKLPQLEPFDEFNQQWQQRVHPEGWNSVPPATPYQLVVVGAGTAGLVTAAGAAGLGARVALIEKALMGGDCLNVGCVPSKALLSAARSAANARDAQRFGVCLDGPVKVDFAEVMQRLRKLRAGISPADSAERFKNLGVDVYFGEAHFHDSETIQVATPEGDSLPIKFRKAVIATGGRAAAPPIPGLDQVSYLTNETLFSLTELPPRLGVIGGGPIGCEMAQAFARFGSQVTLFERNDHVLAREEPDAAQLVQQHLEQDGIDCWTRCTDLSVAPGESDGIRVSCTSNANQRETQVDQLLVAVGRAPNIESLQLDRLGIKSDAQGVVVDDFLRTSHPRVFACGDVCSRFKFTHAADFQARIVIQNALFALGPLGRARASQLTIPWATYTSPELAHVGLTPQSAQQQGIAIDTYEQSLAENDRAVLDGRESGWVRVHTAQGTDRILGATIVAEHAGDLICQITQAMQNRIGLSGIGKTIHPYPTQADAIRRLGDQYNRTRLTPFKSSLLRFLMRRNVGR